MSKAKDKIEELRNKLFENKKKELTEKAQEVIETTMDNTVYDVIQDPSTKSRQFLMVKIKYDLDTKTAAIVDVMPFQDKAAGLTIQMDKENRKYLYEKNSRSKK